MDRTLLQAASVIGRRFDPHLLVTVISESEVDARLAAMKALDLIRPESKSSDYVFKHALVRSRAALSRPRPKSSLPVLVRTRPRSVRKLTISSANSGLPSAFSTTCHASASGRASTPSRARIRRRMSPVGSGSKGNLETSVSASQGGRRPKMPCARLNRSSGGLLD
jgi:hypothetical protein